MNPFHLKLGKLKPPKLGFCAAPSEQERSKAALGGLRVGQRGTPQTEPFWGKRNSNWGGGRCKQP